MQYTIASALLVAGASASVIGGYGLPAAPAAPVAPAAPKNETSWPVYYTEVKTALTTYCPLPTIFTHSSATYTVKSATTLTIPCDETVTYTTSTSVKPTSTPAAPVVVSTTPVVSKPVYTTKPEHTTQPEHTTPVAPYTTAPAPYTYANATVPATYPASSPSASKVTSSGPVQVTANAGSNFAAPGAALAGVMGAVAYLL